MSDSYLFGAHVLLQKLDVSKRLFKKLLVPKILHIIPEVHKFSEILDFGLKHLIYRTELAITIVNQTFHRYKKRLFKRNSFTENLFLYTEIYTKYVSHSN